MKAWKAQLEASLAYNLRNLGWGRKSNETIVACYSQEQMKKIEEAWLLFKLGLALYDMKKYEEALSAFRRIREVNESQDADALIWQGHMLDLLGRREEAVAVYQQVVEIKARSADATTIVDSFGLQYIPRIYAKERMKSPFRRIENLREE